MKLRKNNGFSTIDATIAIIIILIFIPTIFSFGYNVQKTNNSVKRKTRAVEIASDILEISKSMDFDKVDLNEESFKNLMEKHNYTNVISGEYQATGRSKEQYKVNILIKENYPKYVKTVKVKVSYVVGKEEKQIEISTVLKNA